MGIWGMFLNGILFFLYHVPYESTTRKVVGSLGELDAVTQLSTSNAIYSAPTAAVSSILKGSPSRHSTFHRHSKRLVSATSEAAGAGREAEAAAGAGRQAAAAQAGGTCSVCLEDVEPLGTPKRSLIRKLSFRSSSRKKTPSGWPCAHPFHPECVAECLATGNDRCPVCKIGLDGSLPPPPRSPPPWQTSGPGSWQPEPPPSPTSFSDESSYVEQPNPDEVHDQHIDSRQLLEHEPHDSPYLRSGTQAWQESGVGLWGQPSSLPPFSDDSSIAQQLYQDELNNYQSRLQPFEHEPHDSPYLRSGTQAWQESGVGPWGQPSSLPPFSDDSSIAQQLYQDELNNYQSRLQPFEYETYDPHLRSGTQAWQESGFGPLGQPSSLPPSSHDSSIAQQLYRDELINYQSRLQPAFGYESQI